MSIQLHTRKKWGGYVGVAVCVLRGRRVWSESLGISRLTREEARRDAEWLRDQHYTSAQRVLDRVREKEAQ